MSEAYGDYECEVTVIVTAPNLDEAYAALHRSGLRVGLLVGEALIDHVEIYADGEDGQ